MPEANADGPSSPPATEETAAPPPKRRKLRKGTVSCWECKRRKTRCTYATPTTAVCDGCRSRQTSCTSQACSDEPAPAVGRTAARLRRVESLVEQLAKQRGVKEPPPSTEPKKTAPTSPKSPRAAAGGTATSPVREADDEDLDAVSEALLAVWPDEHDMKLILGVPTTLAIMTHGLVCAPYESVLASARPDDGDGDEPWTPVWRQELQERPAPGTHPVVIARRLLLLATLLRGVPDAVAEAQLGGGRLRVDHGTHMRRAVDAAARLVTADDGLAGGSLDGLECVMMEAMYRNNEGRLRRAWLANRRALALAQLRRLPAHAPPALEPATRARVDPAYLWFRLICSDRYLSLMLGLPQGAPGADAAFAGPAALAACGAPFERLERLCTVACGLVIDRNHHHHTARPDNDDVAATTRRVDRMLRDAAALLPPAWWRETPDAAALAGPDARAAFDESLRIMAHLALRHLLVQLHLPYVLATPAIPGAHDYSRMVAADACRAIVGQFAAFRAAVPGTAYCRGVDFVAFIASTVLCLSHIEARRQQQDDDDEDDDSRGRGGGAASGRLLPTAFQSLAHRRPGDRALLDRALAFLDATARTQDDAIARRAGGILRPLLAIEDRAARGGVRYRARASEEAAPGVPADPPAIEDDETPDQLRIEIPCFGTVQVERHPPDPAPPAPHAPAAGPVQPGELEDWDLGVFGGLGNPAEPPFLFDLPADDENAWALQGVDTALFTNLSYGPMGFGDTGPRG